MKRNQLIHFRSVIYSLKRDFAFRIDLYRKTEVLNLETGRKITTKVKYNIKKAIILPNQIFRDFNYASLLRISSNHTNLQYGGILDLKQRGIIIDKRNLPRDFTIDINDYIVFNHNRYEIKEITEMEVADFWALTIKHVEGENPNEIHEQIIKQRLEVEESLDNIDYTIYETIKEDLQFRQRFSKYTIHLKRLRHTVFFGDGLGADFPGTELLNHRLGLFESIRGEK